MVFGCDRRRPADLERVLEAEVQQHLKVVTDFFIRSAAEWRDIVARNPFLKDAERDPSHLVVMVLKDRPSGQAVKDLQAAIAARGSPPPWSRRGFTRVVRAATGTPS